MSNHTVNVTYISPFNGNTVRSVEVSSDRVYMNTIGDVVFRYNDFYPACQVIEVELVDQDRLDAKRNYFEQYGTACE